MDSNSASQLATVESFCAAFYESSTELERRKAEEMLKEFFENEQHALSRCHMVMENSGLHYAQLLSANALAKLVSRPTNQLPLDQRIWLRNFVLSNTYTRCKMPVWVTKSYTQLFAKLTKFNWNEQQNDKFVFRNVIDDVKMFISGDLTQCVLGIEILTSLVEEMNHYEPSRRLNEHRKITNSFRDTCLMEIFTLSRDFLREAVEGGLNPSDDQQCQLMEKLVKLSYSCLSFDFTGNSLDDATDEMCTVQIPGSWRELFVNFKTMNLFLELYQRLPAKNCATVVACLAQMAAIRRSLFTNNERTEYFHNLLGGVKTMLENINHLSDSDTYHEFCKLLARLRAIYQLTEFVKAPCWSDFIRLLAQFTVNSLQYVECPTNSLHYVLSTWHKLVASVPYMRSNEPHHLDKYAPEVAVAYITTRLDQVPMMMGDNFGGSALSDQSSLQQQLEQIAIVARCSYKKVADVIIGLYGQTSEAYSQCPDLSSLRIVQYKLCWLVHIIGAVVGARVSSNTQEDSEASDAELVSSVLMLVRHLDSQPGEKMLDQLELAIMFFLDNFRRVYIGEQMQKVSHVYHALSEVLGLKDEAMLLELIVNKLLSNLKLWAGNSRILSQTLQLLSDLSLTYSGLRKLSKLEPVQNLLRHHSGDALPFLSLENQVMQEQDLKYRTNFYTSLTRLLLVDLGDDDDRFVEFLSPLTVALDSLGQQMLSTNGAVPPSPIWRRVFIGVCRDLRGIVFALNTKNYFNMFFEWFYPRYCALFHKAIELWHNEPAVSSPVLKLYCELVQNRFQRLLFETSPLGILLFRECSELLVKYGERLLSTEAQIPKDKEYQLKLKGIATSFHILKNALSGGFINFAIFGLYGDKALQNSLDMFVSMLLSMSNPHSCSAAGGGGGGTVSVPGQFMFLQYPKLSVAYYNLLEVLTGDHVHFVASVDLEVLVLIMQTIAEGLVSVDCTISTSCCCSLDQLISFLFRKLSRTKKRAANQSLQMNLNNSLEPPVATHFLQVTDTHGELFDQMLCNMLNTVLYEDLRNQWSLSRPLLGLILLRVSTFERFRMEQIQSYSSDQKRASGVQAAFSSLMEGVENNLSNKNKDKFTQNVAVFRRDIGEALRTTQNQSQGESVSVTHSAGDDMI